MEVERDVLGWEKALRGEDQAWEGVGSAEASSAAF